MATTEANNSQNWAPLSEIARRIDAQRAQRYPDAGPNLKPLGMARFRHERGRLAVAFAQFTASSAPEATERVITYAHQLGATITWTVNDLDGEGRPLATALRARGFTLDERLYLMARQGELLIRPNPAITIRPISSWAEMWAYERGNRQSFYDDPEPEAAVVTSRASERWRQQQLNWYQHYIALLNGAQIGGLYITLWEDIPTIMGVYTLESARQHGCATAALARVIHDAVIEGKNAYCLFVKEGNPARKLYEQLGFQLFGVEETFTFDPLT